MARLYGFFCLPRCFSSPKSNYLYYFCTIINNNCKTMEATIQRKQTSFRLRTDLLEFMKEDAERQNRTLNNFLESLLLDYYYNEPNEVTKAAIEEAMSGRNRNKVYDSVDEMFADLLNDDEE